MTSLLPAGQADSNTAASLAPAAPAVTRVHPCAAGGGLLFGGQVLHDGRTVRPPIQGGILNRGVGVSTAWEQTQ